MTTLSALGLARTLHAESIKIRRSPALWVLLLVTLIIAIGLTALVAGAGGAPALYKGRSTDGASPYEVLFFGSSLAVWAYAFFGAILSAGEFSNGLIRYSFTAMPGRSRVLLAKLILVAAIGAIAGELISFANLAITDGVLRARGYPALPLSDPKLLRAVTVLIPAQLLAWGSLALLFGFIIRRATPATAVLFAGSLLPLVTSPLLPHQWGQDISRWIPDSLAESLAGVALPGTSAYVPPAEAALALSGWIAAFLSIALVVVHRRDV